jgi:excinuclease ABC subunit A
LDRVKRLVVVDQKPIGRTPRSNLATYTGLLDHVRKLFAGTKQARARRYDAGRFSFNVAKGRCETCEGEGYVCVELLFLPSVYTPCPTCRGARYNPKTLEIKIRDKSIADVLAMTVDAALWAFCARSGSVTLDLASRPPNFQEERRNASNSPPSSSAPIVAAHYTFSTSRRRDCIRPMSQSSAISCKGSSRLATPSFWSSMICLLQRRATGS